MKAAVIVGFGVLSLLGGAASAQNTPQVVMRRAVSEPGDIKSSELATVATRVASLAIESANIQVTVGDTVSLDSLVIAAFDSAGTRIGRLRVFDSTLKLDRVLDPAGMRRYVAVAEGIATITCRYPRAAWKDRTDPQAEVSLSIVVKP
ncbi:MAG: hypothetical protein H7Z40_06600 [Phycisphaerae bacterium]|nr:hypothetical protein [Gemmatimonadaceae bacterium]